MLFRRSGIFSGKLSDYPAGNAKKGCFARLNPSLDLLPAFTRAHTRARARIVCIIYIAQYVYSAS